MWQTRACKEPTTRSRSSCCDPCDNLTATYAGLLNTDDPDYVANFVRAAAEGFEAALAAADRSRAGLLLRLLGALVVPGVLHPSAVIAALEGVVRAALEIAEEGGPLQKHTPNGFSDFKAQSCTLAHYELRPSHRKTLHVHTLQRQQPMQGGLYGSVRRRRGE